MFVRPINIIQTDIMDSATTRALFAYSSFSCILSDPHGVALNRLSFTNPCHVCRPSHSEFCVVFSETRVNTGQDSLERPPRRAFQLQFQVPQVDNLSRTYNQPTNDNTQGGHNSTTNFWNLIVTKFVPANLIETCVRTILNTKVSFTQ